MNEESRHPIYSILGCLFLCYAVGFVGAQGTNAGLAPWYLILNKPSWNPPIWIFAPVGTVLYAMMGTGLWLVWRSRNHKRVSAAAVFCFQLILNGAWPWLFFAWHFLFASTLEIFVLWFAVALTSMLFFRVSRPASYLLIPYLLWLSFTAALNFSIWRMNPNGAGVQNVNVADQPQKTAMLLDSSFPSSLKILT